MERSQKILISTLFYDFALQLLLPNLLPTGQKRENWILHNLLYEENIINQRVTLEALSSCSKNTTTEVKCG